jgi:hypothetical protein
MTHTGRGHGYAYVKRVEPVKGPGEEAAPPQPQQGPPRAPDLGSITGVCLCVCCVCVCVCVCP